MLKAPFFNPPSLPPLLPPPPPKCVRVCWNGKVHSVVYFRNLRLILQILLWNHTFVLLEGCDFMVVKPFFWSAERLWWCYVYKRSTQCWICANRILNITKKRKLALKTVVFLNCHVIFSWLPHRACQCKAITVVWITQTGQLMFFGLLLE